MPIAVQKRSFALRSFIVSLCLFATSAAASSNADESTRLFRQAMQSFKIRDYPRSRTILEQLLRANPKKPLYWFNLGNTYYMQGDFGRARIAYEWVMYLKSPLAPAAAVYIARCNRELRKFDDAMNGLQTLSQMSLPPGLTVEARNETKALQKELLKAGIEHYQRKEYWDSAHRLDQAHELGPDPEIDPELSMMHGLALLHLGELKEAKERFEQASSLDAASVSPSRSRLRDEAHAYIEMAKEQAWDKEYPFRLTLDLAAGYNSNVFGDGSSETISTSPSSQLTASASYRAQRTQRYVADLGYTVSWEETYNYSTNRLLTQTIWGYFGLAQNPWVFHISPSVRYTRLGSESFLFKPELDLKGRRKLGAREIGFAYSIGVNIPGSSTYSYLTGLSQSIQVSMVQKYYGVSFTPYLLAVQEGLRPDPVSTGSLPLGYYGVGPGLSLLWFPAPMWQFSSNNSVLLKYYKDVSQPGDLKRQDRQLSSSLKVLRQLRNSLSAYVTVDLLLNGSTLGATAVDDKNFFQTIAMGGLTWELLP